MGTGFRKLWQERPRSFAQLCRQLDAEYQLPRPATAQHLPPYQAVTQLLGLAGEAVILMVAGFLSAWLLVCAAQWLAINPLVELIAHLLGILAVLLALADAVQLWLPYYQTAQRVTHGSARWADATTLQALGLAQRRNAASPPFTLPLGKLGHKHEVVLSSEHSACHLALFGPPGAGKSSTFFIHWQRTWARDGSVVTLDPKGELYDQTAYLFRNVYRLDLQQPERSDRWNFLPACKENAEYAHKVASLILDTEQSKRSSSDPFWKEAEKAALTAILLELNQLHARPAPQMIQELISTCSLQRLNEMMMQSQDAKVPLYWGMFSKVEPKLQASVLIGLGVAAADFATPNTIKIASPIMPLMEARGIRWIDFARLREPGTAIFLVVPEGDAERYKRVLATFIGLANDCLRNSELREDTAPVLFNLDEIGNIPLPDLPAALGVGRGRRMTYALGYQNIAQLYHQYSADGGDAILGSIGALLFLPGVDQRTAEYASKRVGTTTVLQSTSVDVHDGDRFDSERTSETARALMDAAEVRQMVKFKQAVAVISNAPPVRLRFPAFAKQTHPPLCARERRYQAVRPDVGTAIDELSLVMTETNEENNAVPVQRAWRRALRRADNANSELRFEPEYDPALLNDDDFPLFDLGLERG